MRLNQSLSMGGALLLNSTHTAQLQESLHETRRSLERSHHIQEVTERSRRQLEAKLEDFQKRYDEIVGVKHTLESQQLGLEHEVKISSYHYVCVLGGGGNVLWHLYLQSVWSW